MTMKAWLAERFSALTAGEGRALDGKGRLPLDRARLALAEVLVAAKWHGLDLDQIPVEEVTLETVFINLTGRDLRE